ncbi:MAG: AcrB/AcrD/AcrF family protein [Candidatus Riflebacteria bacterium HGW-Riflebacteria-1]|jgi:HAE1 family hydrophobic/amphiphilic exporter-1|nr:MAG: AcrB/AcrD/AcrF family protein [Candidatus Riflebacteria bacterium HGW-Riflebacteria-1]
MKLSEFGVRWPVTTSMIFIACVVLGGFAYTRVGIDLMPEMNIPVISVITSYSGAGPHEIETRITEVIEERVATVQNVDKVTSSSMEGVSMITVRFNWDTDLSEAANDIRERIDLIRKYLPDGAENPMILKFDMSAIPVMVLCVTADESWEKLDRIVDKKITDALKRLPGVATAVSQGGLRRTIRVKLNRERLKATGITGQQIVQVLHAQNLSNPGGNVRTGMMDFLIRTPGEFTSVEEIGEVVIANSSGIIRLKDVAEIEDGFAEKSDELMINGKPAIGIIVQKQSGGNTFAVSQAVRAALPEIQAQLPSDVKITEFFDSANFIKSTVYNLRNALFVGGIGVFLVILFFIRDVRASLIVSTTVPTSLIITFLLMYMNGYTINQISLSSLAIALGMVVDNAIVILDNIKRYLDRGVNVRESAIWGAAEMGTAVVASTMTTIAIFLPIIFTSGITKIMFGQLATIVTMALIASLFSSLLLTPMLCSKFLKNNAAGSSTLLMRIGGVFDRVENFYGAFLQRALRNRYKVLAVLIVIFVLSLAIIPLVGVEYMPQQDQGFLFMEVELPTGTRYEETTRVCQQIGNTIRENTPELKSLIVTTGVTEDVENMIFSPKKASNYGKIEMTLLSKNQRTAGAKEIISRLRPLLDNIPGTVIRFTTTDPIGEMIIGASADFSIDIYGHDLEQGVGFANTLVKALMTIENLKDLEVSQKLARPEMQVKVNREKASALGLNVSDIARGVELYFSGDRTAKFREGGEEYDIEVRLRPEDRVGIADLDQINILAPNRQSVRLSNLANLEQALGPIRIERTEQQRYIKVTGQVFGTDPGTVIKRAAEVLKDVPVPPGFSWAFSGNEKERVDSFLLLLQAAVLGMILVYMVMASQFESLLAPFIIFLSIPFGFMGAIQLLAVTGNRISVVSLLGFIILIGIVVNNGIVLISYINMLIRREIKLNLALVEAGKSRLRPVISTSCTTAIGMLPMALSTGDGSEVWVPIGLSVIGGLFVSTIMTLVLMPVLYSLLQRWLVPEDLRE